MNINERKIEVSVTPHPWDNKENPYFWCILDWDNKNKTWFNNGFGWSKSIELAFKDATDYLEKYKN